MKIFKCYFLLMLFAQAILAQQPGDTIRVKTFNYKSKVRDTLVQFPSTNLSYEKIIMKYNMRCKDALVSTGTQRNLGCGEWDYSCNTFLVDSTKVEQALSTHPDYTISNFSGASFDYVNQPTYDYYKYSQTQVSQTITSETQFSVGSATLNNTTALKTDEKSGKSIILYTAAELLAAGFSAGNVNGILLNVTNAGGNANFFRVGMKHSSLSVLNAANFVTTGFTTVYNNSFSFVNGNNRIQFHTPFVWDGTSNLLVEYSFTNTQGSSPIVLSASNTTVVSALAVNNNYALDLSSDGHAVLNTALMSNISNEMTISFWAYGYAAVLQNNTSLIEGLTLNKDRSLMIHLPYANTVYFDCGNNGANYDRISKAATANNLRGQWNQWTFTKNATTGEMKIYLNAVLWAQGTGKTNPISIVNLILGKGSNLDNNYKGKINELSIWNKALSFPDIQAWYRKAIDPSHPFYANLIAYYKMDEAMGQIINDVKNNLTSNCKDVFWTYDRGHTLSNFFKEGTLRPNITLLRGAYSLVTSVSTITDSVLHRPSILKQYTIISNAAAIPMKSDSIAVVSTSKVYEDFVYEYNGDNGLLLNTIFLNSIGSIVIGNLPYFNRYPYYNEIMSFVTPYGIGLDFGVNGKTWYFDVSDYAPILKGKRRFVMALGGEFQEQMDVEFLFIVGTPPRPVLEFKQLWQGAARLSGVPIASVLNNTEFASQSVPLLATGKAFKMRSTITGHGAAGEFNSNGGPISHFFNLNGGANEFTWSVNQKCSSNPVFPQGGTWVYDRQGWCPGEPSYLKEYDISSLVTAGTTVNMDYNCSAPNLPNGDYRYIVAHQLVTYGNPSHTLDASLEDVEKPSNKILFARTNPMCDRPIVVIRNTGSTSITAMQIEYWLNTASTKQVYNWTGNLAFMDTAQVILPIAAIWQYDLKANANIFHAALKTVNGVSDQYVHNNQYHSPFVVTDIVGNSFKIAFKTNNVPLQNTYKIVDENGVKVNGASNLTTANTVYTDSYTLNGCYKLIVTDAGNDGLEWFANQGQGVGSVQLLDANNTILKTFEPDFGSGFEYSFSTNALINVEKRSLENTIQIFPNPASSTFYITGEVLHTVDIRVFDMTGRKVTLPYTKTSDKQLVFDTRNVSTGVYYIKIIKGKESIIRKLVISE